jgi:hypothetical protein
VYLPNTARVQVRLPPNLAADDSLPLYHLRPASAVMTPGATVVATGFAASDLQTQNASTSGGGGGSGLPAAAAIVSVRVIPVNDPPALTAPMNLPSIPEDETYESFTAADVPLLSTTLSTSYTDPDGGVGSAAVGIAVTSAPANAFGRWTWTCDPRANADFAAFSPSTSVESATVRTRTTSASHRSAFERY